MAGRRQDVETEIAALYREPLPGWTAARNALAARLKGEGRKGEAGTVKALRKPSVSAWAVNQLFLREPEGMEALFAAGKAARAAQGQAASGRGAEAFREAQKEARKQIEALRRRAVALLGEGGTGASAAVAERIGRDLEALAFSPAAAEAAARGWLDADLDPPGFEVLTGLRLVAPPRPKPAAPPPAKRAERAPDPEPPSRLLDFKRQSAAESREEAAARKRAADDSARQAREEARRRERIERAQAALARAEEKATALRATADAADRHAAEARRQAERAERDAATARRHAETAEAERDRARENLAEVQSA